MTTCAIAVAAASCFIKPDPPGVGGDGSMNHDAANRGDGVMADGSLPFGCSHVGLHLDFVGMTLSDCGSWAVTGGSVSASNNSPLVMAVQPPSGSSCTSKTPSSGAYIRLAAIPPVSGDTLFLRAILLNDQLITMRVVAGTGKLELTGPDATATAGWSPQIEWLRLAADGPSSLIGEYSIDGTHWATLGTQSANGAPINNITMSFGVAPSSSGGGSGSFYEYDECR